VTFGQLFGFSFVTTFLNNVQHCSVSLWQMNLTWHVSVHLKVLFLKFICLFLHARLGFKTHFMPPQAMYGRGYCFRCPVVLMSCAYISNYSASQKYW